MTNKLQAKYHKSHLYYEPQFDAPAVPDVVWFESDFGIRFGLMICFDIMFEEPQMSLYHRHGIRNFLWSSWWVNEPPLITGTQVELARSLSLPSNFLASGIGLSWYNSGSGIYSYGDPLQHWYNIGSKPISRMMIAELPEAREVEERRKLARLSNSDSVTQCLAKSNSVHISGGKIQKSVLRQKPPVSNSKTATSGPNVQA